MEKIYEQNGKKKQSFFQQFFNDKGSMVAVIVVAVVAVVGLVAFGFNQISYAADETGGQGVPGPDVAFVSAQGTDTILGDAGNGITMAITPFMKKSDLSEYVICTDFLAEFTSGKDYYFYGNISDAGVKYLITELDKVLPKDKPLLAYWLKQSAVWAYLLHFEDEGRFAGEDEEKVINYRMYTKENLSVVSNLYSQSTGNTLFETTSSFWADYNIASIYDAAVAKKEKGEISSDIQFVAAIAGLDDKFSISDDGKKYVSSSFGVSSPNANDMLEYALYLGDAPEGTTIYHASGELNGKPCELENGLCYVYNAADKFKIMVPRDKVTDSNKNIKVYVNAVFEGDLLAYFGSEGYQTVITTGPVFGNAIAEKQVTINYTPDVPDTGMTTAQTIYFIGLIILLSGVGIIYANAKPREEN